MTEDEILKRYGRQGTLTHLPSKHEARLEVLAWVAGPIRPGIAYRESEINDLLRRFQEMQKLVKQLSRGKMPGLPGVGGLFGGGGGPFGR